MHDIFRRLVRHVTSTYPLIKFFTMLQFLQHSLTVKHY